MVSDDYIKFIEVLSISSLKYVCNTFFITLNVFSTQGVKLFYARPIVSVETGHIYRIISSLG